MPTPAPLNYGNTFSLRVTNTQNNDLVLLALDTYLKDEPDQDDVPSNPSDYTRTVVGGPPVFASSYQWTIFDPQNLSSRRRVKFGDTVILSVSQSRSSAYLSARDDHKLDGSRRVGVVSQPAPWEQWKIVDPNNLNSTGEVSIGDTCALVSSFSEYLSRKAATGIVAGAATIGIDEKWKIEPAKAVYLRYGGLVAIDSLGDAAHSKSVVSATTRQPEADLFRVTLGSHDQREQRWIVRKFDDLNSNSRMRFGDAVLFTLDAELTGTPLYLSCRMNQGAGEGSQAVLSVAYPYPGNPGEWERWTVFDPDDESSRREIKVGDQLVLSGMQSLRLSSGRATEANPELTARPRGSGQVGDTQRWVFTPVMPDFSGDSVDINSLKGLPATDYGAALLDMGKSMERELISGAANALGTKVPGGGGLATFAVNYIWPEGSPDIWALIKDKVIALVDDKIAEERFSNFSVQLQNVKVAIRRYADTTNASRKGELLDDALGKLNDARNACEKLEKPQYSLPHLVALGTLHLIALREMYAYGQRFFPDQSKADRATALRELKEGLTYYQQKVSDAVRDATSWRESFIKWNDYGLSAGITEDYQPDDFNQRYLTAGYDGKFGLYRTYVRYRKTMMSIYGQLLDVYRLPSNLWRLLAPDCEDVPVRTSAVMTTGRFGQTDGILGDTLRIYLDPMQVNQPITLISLSPTRGDAVFGLQFRCGNDSAGWRGRDGGQMTNYDIWPGEKIVEVQGRTGEMGEIVNPVFYLCFITNRGRRFEAGDPNSNQTLWVSKPLAGTNGHLIGVSAWASSASWLWSVYLHWQYDRWLVVE